MKRWLYLGIGIGALWIQLTVFSWLSVFGLKPNLLLLTVLVLGLRWMEPWLFVYAALAGLALDVFSHGVLGIYGLSMFLTAFAALYVGNAMYENSLWFIVSAVAGLSLFEGVVSVSIFEMLDPNVPWWNWLLTRSLPVSVYHGFLAPFLLWGMIRLERLLKIGDMMGARQ